jgi:hypothetical protein
MYTYMYRFLESFAFFVSHWQWRKCDIMLYEPLKSPETPLST